MRKAIDSNPTLLEPDTFVLNVPPYARTMYDLENSSWFTCSQPTDCLPTLYCANGTDEIVPEDNEEAGTKVNYVTLFH